MFSSKASVFGRKIIHEGSRRGFSSYRSPTYSIVKPLIGLNLAAAGAYYFYRRNNREIFSGNLIVHAASKPAPQDNVWTDNRDHALYLWIHVKPTANAKQCAKSISNVQKLVDQVSPPDMRDESDEIVAGVGFGYNFFSQLTGKRPDKNFNYPLRKGELGELPSTGGDIFIHAKSNSTSKLFELAQLILKNFPADSIQSFQDIYSFVYQNQRDLSGFIDGTENVQGDEDRIQWSSNGQGGSYCITQRWVHQFDVINSAKDSDKETFVGRTIADSTELKRKSATSHVARMTSGTTMNAPKPTEIVRQSMPYGTLSTEAGLFFIGFANDPNNFEYMLERMVGATPDGLCDDIMKLTKCVTGNYWYFPSQEQLKTL